MKCLLVLSVIFSSFAFPVPFPSNDMVMPPISRRISPQVIINFGPFEPIDDDFYAKEMVLKVVLQPEEVKKKKIHIDSSSANAESRKVAGKVPEPDALSDQRNPIKLRQHLEEVRSTTRHVMEAIDRLSKLTDAELMASSDQVLLRDVNSLLTDHSKKTPVSDLQNVLCPALELEAKLRQEWMMNEVLDAVGTLLGEPVTKAQIMDMHGVVMFVKRFQGQFVDPEEGLNNFSNGFGKPKLKDSKTVKKVLTDLIDQENELTAE